MLDRFVLEVIFSFTPNTKAQGLRHYEQSYQTGLSPIMNLNYPLSGGIPPMIQTLKRSWRLATNIQCVGLDVQYPYDTTFWQVYDMCDTETKSVLLREWVPYA